jgi:hypothetical protein
MVAQRFIQPLRNAAAVRMEKSCSTLTVTNTCELRAGADSGTGMLHYDA